METPVTIDFQGSEPSESVRSAVLSHVEDLERRFGRVTACRIVVKAPGHHHREGGLFEVNIHLALPNGKEVNVARTPRADERYANVQFAVNDAFKRARRQLQDRVRRLQGAIKVHEGEPIGTVSRLLDDYGFIEAAAGREVYFHRNSVLNGGFTKLNVGSRVTFCEEAGEKGPQASTVKLLKKHKMQQ
jgi:cold shock CspA family protein/ribosome-associated translation inhibitor RaiA